MAKLHLKVGSNNTRKEGSLLFILLEKVSSQLFPSSSVTEGKEQGGGKIYSSGFLSV